MLKKKVTAYIAELNRNTDGGSQSHVTLHQLYRSFGKEKVNAEIQRQFDVQKTEKFLPQVRFNWGFHDATGDGKDGRPAREMGAHFDPFYAAGYTVGYRVWTETRTRPDTSALAWFTYVTETPGALDAVRIAESKMSAEYLDAEAEERARVARRENNAQGETNHGHI